MYHVVFNRLLKETGEGLRVIVSKCPAISHCSWTHKCLIEVKYNTNDQLGILNRGDHLIEVKFTVK